MFTFETLLVVTLCLLKTSDAQTIADLIQGRRDLSRAWAARANFPEWSGPGPVTVFLPTDTALAAVAPGALPAGSLGSLTVNRTIDFLRTPNYQIMTDTGGVVRIVYDNYAGGQPVPEIHCRFGIAEALTIENLRATNGWLYTLTRAIEPPLPLSTTLRSMTLFTNGLTRFLAAVDRAGIREELDSLRGATILVFENNAVGIERVDALSVPELRALLRSHIVPNVHYSIALDPSMSFPSLNTGFGWTVAVGASDVVEFNGARIVLADIMVTSGVAHTVNRVIFPANLPTTTTTTTTTAVTRLATTSSSSSSTVTSGAAPNPTNSAYKPPPAVKDQKNGSSSVRVEKSFFYFGLALFSALFFFL